MSTTLTCSFCKNTEECQKVRDGRVVGGKSVVGRGSESPDFLIVGEGPNWEDSASGSAFSGSAESVLKSLLKEAGIDSRKVRYVLSVRCKLPNNLPPLTKQINLCRANLNEEIIRYRPKVIIPMGNIPCKSLLKKAGIKTLRGLPSTITVEGSGRQFTVLPTFSLHSLVYDPAMEAYIRQDFKRAAQILYGDTDALQDTDYQTVAEPSQASVLLKELSALPNGTVVAMDIEANSVNVYAKDYKIISIAVCCEEKKSTCVLFEKISPRKFLGKLFALKNIRYLFHNGTYDVGGIRRYVHNFNHAQWLHDTILMSYLLDENTSHGLKALTAVHIPEMAGYESDISADVEEKGWEGIDLSTLAKYNCTDADMTYRLYNKFLPQIEEQGMKFLYDKIVMGGIRVLQEISFNGLCMDKELAAELVVKYRQVVEDIHTNIQGYPAVKKLIRLLAQEKMDKYNNTHKNQKDIECFMEPFNPASTQQKAKLIFDVLGYKVLKTSKTSGNASVDKGVLEEYAKKDKLCAKLIEYSKVGKLLGTYIEPVVPKWLNTFDGRSHSTYSLHTTVTGRGSSKFPNHENIPRPDTNPDVRQMFVAPAGKVLMEADFSQLELRIAAMYGQDKVMSDAFANGKDVHKILASKFYKIPIEEITKEQRTAAKKTNFGVLYGMESKRLAGELNVSEKVAEGLIHTFFTTFSGIKHWVAKTKLFAMQNRYVCSNFGRKRRIPAIVSQDKMLRLEAERQAVNAPIQGLGSDFMMLSLARISRLLKKNPQLGAKLVATVHDSVVLECSEKYAKQLADAVLKIMSDFHFDWMNGVPIEAEIKIGKNWAKMEVYNG